MFDPIAAQPDTTILFLALAAQKGPQSNLLQLHWLALLLLLELLSYAKFCLPSPSPAAIMPRFSSMVMLEDLLVLLVLLLVVLLPMALPS